MIEVRPVRTRREQREFLNFPLNLYKDNPCFAPPLYMDEKKIFRRDYVYYETCEAVYYNAYRDGTIVGRISGILQKAHNEKTGERRIRFTRFDCIEDFSVAQALFGAVEEWAREKGMDTVCGPLGFSDLEREGLLIEGFDQPSTFEEQYNAPYYGEFIARLGYEKEVDWVESQLRFPADYDGSLEKLADFVLNRYHLRFVREKNVRTFLRRWGDKFFDLLDICYRDLYGTVAFTPGTRKMMVKNFKLIVNLRFVAAVVDENDELVCLGICFPSLTEALQKSRGHLTLAALWRVMRALRHPRIIDLGLVGVRPDMANRGIGVAICAGLMRMMSDPSISHAETNLNLEDNFAVRNQWKRFDQKENKRRRAYIKRLDPVCSPREESV